MKKYLFYIVILVTIAGLTIPRISLSQGKTDFDRAYQEYSLKVEDYQKARDGYILARSQFLKFKTLTSQNNAKEATLMMLKARDDVVLSYINVLKEKIEETRGIPDATRDGVLLRLDSEVSWFSSHKDKLTSAGSLEDLVSDSDEARRRHEDIDSLLYEALSIVSSGKISRFRERLNETFSLVREKVGEIREEEKDDFKFSTRKLEIIDRWVFETENRVTRSEEKQTDAENLIAEFPGLEKKSSSKYNEVLSKLGESQQYLKEASLFIKEIIREIKTAE